ncbi:hypothetical protein IW261DRAFT_1652792 [Armillaria novae-zelandiae]|uniref:Aldos-2-ulose dehydratase/isomerase (AUDH) Cupin domain-containing protein n=1 Tax=Armillaria novae-zelandiae TaxID=153914 RepID=A0AA39PQ60_9AGAR|nr:hypothetical protein IW261DRAFT_1652792 [Armillaria novae-zelandiae]
MHSFFPRIIDAVEDGYWIEKFPFHCADDVLHPSVIAYGLGTKERKSDITIFHNQYHPENTLHKKSVGGWDKVTIASLWFPVSMAFADISGNGCNDVIISDRYGPSMDELWPEGGRIQWFENIGDPSKEQWQRRYIGQSPGMHRLRVGHFTRTDVIQIVALPVITRSSDLDTPVPVIIYTKPDDPMSVPAPVWEKVIPFNSNFRVVHEVVVIPSCNGDLDAIMLASREGISFLWYDDSAKKWKFETLGTGMPEIPGSRFWGSGSVGVGKVHDDHAGYIASSEAMHGNYVTVYVKDEDALPNQFAGVRWTRHILDEFTSPSTGHAPGVIHQVVCADIDGDGVDEFLVAMMGSDPPSWERTGVWCYKPVDLKNGKFAKFKLGDVSAGRVALGNYRSPHVLDFATISYSVPGYFESPIPLVLLYEATPITAEKLNDEVLFRVPRPDAIRMADKVEFLDVASQKMSLVVVPPSSQYPVKQGDGVKVIAGRVLWTDKDGKLHERTQAPAPFEASTVTVEAEGHTISTRNEGAVFVLFEKSATSGQPPFTDMSQLRAHNLFPLRFPSAVRHTTFPWVKVEDTPWANGRFKGDEFYNLVGFHVRYADDSDKSICHIQLWTAGVNVSAGFHNHIGQCFAEIHTCIVNGTGKGGMSWATVSDGKFDPANPDKNLYSSVVVPSMSEHGPLWRTSADGMPLFRDNGTVDYPWHAWIAGNGDPDKQKFDVWVAFEFPAFISLAKEANVRALEPGRYRLINAKAEAAAAVEGGDSIDGASLVVSRSNLAGQTWDLEMILGTNLYTLKNVSFASSDWPVENGQKLIGTRSLAALGVTTSWSLDPVDHQKFRIRLVDTNLVWSVNKNDNIVLAQISASHGQDWIFENVDNKN